MCGRGRNTIGGVESVALPQGSVCKPLSTPQSCFHKEIYKTGLRCALLPCIMSERVCVSHKWTFSFLFSFASSMQERYPPKFSSPGRSASQQSQWSCVNNLFSLVVRWVCALVCECIPHIHPYKGSILLAFGIIYKAGVFVWRSKSLSPPITAYDST